MKEYFVYTGSLMKHKWYVFIAGLKTKAPIWNLIIHDASKFRPDEFIPYAQYFYKKDRSNKNELGSKFRVAVRLHKSRNKHHEEYWGGKPMPEIYVRELVADWMGACRGYNGHWPTSIQDWTWARLNLGKAKAKMHIETQKMLDKVLSEVLEDTSWLMWYR